MPNWVYTSFEITGDENQLRAIRETGLKFHKIRPCPYLDKDMKEHKDGLSGGLLSQSGMEWYDWCVEHWGTKWEAQDISLELEGDSLVGHFNTAWSPPTQLLAYLTHVYQGIRVRIIYEDECYCFVGHGEGEKGKLTTWTIHPSEYSLAALRAFATENDWFDVDGYAQCFDEGEPEEVEKGSGKPVEVIEEVTEYHGEVEKIEVAEE